MASKLFALDSGTVREILKLHALDGATPRRVKKLFGLDGSTVRMIFEDFSQFVITGQANLIQSPVNEVIEFGVRSDFNSGGTDVSVNASASGDASNVGGISGLSIDVDSSHSYNTTVAAGPSSGSGSSIGVPIYDHRPPSQSIAYDYPGFTGNPDGLNGRNYVGAALNGSYPSLGSSTNYSSTYAQQAVLRGNISSNLGNPIGSGSSTNFGSGFFVGLTFKTAAEAGVQGNSRHQQVASFGGENYLCASYRSGNTAYWDWGGNPYQHISARAYWILNYYSGYGGPYSYVWHVRPSNLSNPGIVSISGRVYVGGYTTTQSNTGRRARVVNGSNRTYYVSGGGLTAGGNFATGNLSAGASTGFITANSTSEAWTLTGTGTKNPATFSINNANNSIQVSGTFSDGSNADSARDQIQAALNANSTFQSKFNTGADSSATRSGATHSLVTFTGDSDENTQDFSMSITQNDGSNTTPFEQTVTQGATESLQTQIQVTRAVEGSQVSSTKSISSLANIDTMGAEVATLGDDITYDASTDKLKVQDSDATVAITNANTAVFTKQ